MVKSKKKDKIRNYRKKKGSKKETFNNEPDDWWILSQTDKVTSDGERYNAQNTLKKLTNKYKNPDRIELVPDKNKLTVNLDISKKGARPGLYSATWLNIEGCDEIVVYEDIYDKYHPYKAILYVIAKKLMPIPDHLLGALKYASETINIEQLRTNKEINDKYREDGTKQMAMVSGSCASIFISVITLDFVMKMVNQYSDAELFYSNNDVINSPDCKNQECKTKITKRMKEFREAYNDRVHIFLTTGDLGSFENNWFVKENSVEFKEEGYKGNGNPETKVGEIHKKLGERLY